MWYPGSNVSEKLVAFILTWWWRQQTPPKRRFLFTKLHGVTPQNTRDHETSDFNLTPNSSSERLVYNLTCEGRPALASHVSVQWQRNSVQVYCFSFLSVGIPLIAAKYTFCFDKCYSGTRQRGCINVISLKGGHWVSSFASVDRAFQVQWSLYVPPVYHSPILRSAHTVYLWVLYGSENKQRLFPYTALTDWFV